MRLSCNGCRVLRKGCSDNCSIRPCLEWIKCPHSQANATVFLAKFYGRAGLMNLINAGHPNLRPGLYYTRACGRIVNPVYGSVGLLGSGNWQLCQDAVEAVLKGAPVVQIATDAAEARNRPPIQECDIRHINKDGRFPGSTDPHRIRNRRRFKRSDPGSKQVRVSVGSVEASAPEEVERSPSHQSSLSHQSHAAAEPSLERKSRECESLASAGDVEPEPASEDARTAVVGEIELGLTLGFEPLKRLRRDSSSKRDDGSAEEDAGLCKIELGLDCSAS